MPRQVTFPYTYTLPAIYLAVPGTTIIVDQHNTPLEDLQNTLNTAQPINYGGTGATTAADALSNLGAVSGSQVTYISAGGTATVMTLTPTSPLVALAGSDGTQYPFIAIAASTGSATMNVSGTGARAVRKIVGGTDVAIVAGDIAIAGRYVVEYSSTANSLAGGWILVSPTSLTGVDLSTAQTLTNKTLVSTPSINKVAITAPASGSTLTIADGKTLTASSTLTLAGVDGKTLSVNNSMTLAGTDGTTMTFPSTSATVARTDAANTFTGTQTFSGLITANGGQIAFPATQIPSANVNTLDDYEEGTFTPALLINGSATGITYTTQSGNYIKIGRLLYITVDIVLSSKGAATGNVTMTGFPFTSTGGIGNASYLGAAFFANMASVVGNPIVQITDAATTGNLFISGTTGTSFATNANLTNTTNLSLSGSYLASA